MGDKTGIEWTDATWNPIVGCSIVSPGCTNCYAMAMAQRIRLASEVKDGASHYCDVVKLHPNGKPVWTGKVALAPEHILTAPLHWKKPRRIFVNSMGDLFHDDVPDEWIDKVFAVMALCPQHTFQVLTKRSKRMREYLSSWDRRNGINNAIVNLSFDVRGPHSPSKTSGSINMTSGDPSVPLPNVWLGVSAEDQARADERIPDLLATPAAVRFVSAEPLLGPINLHKIQTVAEDCYDALRGGWYLVENGKEFSLDGERLATLDWIITGGESGPGARPANPQWFRDIRDQCRAASCAYFHKQNGEFASVSEVEGPGAHFSFDDHRTVRRVGKKAAGRLLDGKTHDGFPGGRA